MCEREARFDGIMRRLGKTPGVMANRIIELEDRVRELKDEMHSAALGLMTVATKNAKK